MFPIIPANSAAESGNDEGIFGFGWTGGGAENLVDETNLVSNTGVVSSDVTGVGSNRQQLAACEYGGDKGIFGFGYLTAAYTAITNLVSNTGVVASDTAGVGTARSDLAACSYGGDKGIFGFGYEDSPRTAVTNLVSNAGVVASDTAGVLNYGHQFTRSHRP